MESLTNWIFSTKLGFSVFWVAYMTIGVVVLVGSWPVMHQLDMSKGLALSVIGIWTTIGIFIGQHPRVDNANRAILAILLLIVLSLMLILGLERETAFNPANVTVKDRYTVIGWGVLVVVGLVSGYSIGYAARPKKNVTRDESSDNCQVPSVRNRPESQGKK